MGSTIRRRLWGGFAVRRLLVAHGLAPPLVVRQGGEPPDYGFVARPRDGQLLAQVRRHFADLKGLTDQQIELMKQDKPGNANEYMLEAARIRRSAPDFYGTLATQHRRQEDDQLEEVSGLRQGL